MFSLKTDPKLLKTVKSKLDKVLKKSRFTMDVVVESNKLKIEKIRLKQSKDYCGSHAGPCQITGIKHRHQKYLEGADWVAFNDMINDILDNLDCDADVRSSVCIIRKGKLRRIRYSGGGHGDFLKDESSYENRCGKEPIKSSFPEGTPGISDYMNSPK